MSPLAFAAAPTAPAAGSLPGNFSVAGEGTPAATYELGSGSTTSATIAITTPGTAATALTFGAGSPGVSLKTSTGSSTLPSGVTQNSGFSIGSGATVAVTGASNLPLLINDRSGNPSQIYGTVTNTGTGAMFVANASGVIVGATGTITTGGSLGLLGYAQSPATFGSTGTIAIDSSTIGTGDVTLLSGATVTPKTSPLLVASNGAINIGSGSPVQIVSGYGLSGTPGTPVLGSALTGSAATVTFSGGSTTVAAIDAAGDVTNSGVTNFAAATGVGSTSPVLGGTFSNTGIATVGSSFSAGSIVNAGELETASSTGLALSTTGSGNFTNNGVIAFTAKLTTAGQNSLSVNAANIDFGGQVQQNVSTSSATATPVALSTTSPLGNLILDATYTPSGGTAVPGVVDVASTVYSPFTVSGQAVRIMSGGLIDPTGGADLITVGTGTATDPFFNNAKLAYNLSLFGDTVVSSGSPTGTFGAVTIASSEPTTTTTYSNINLNGILGGSSTDGIILGSSTAPLGNINGDATGGLSVANGGTVTAYFTGNMNNPYGMAQAGQTSYLYNSLPITVANNTTTGKAGTATLTLSGPTSSSGSAQNVNVMVAGNVILTSVGTAPILAPTTATPVPTPITPTTPYTNNHLIVQSTGNIAVGGGNNTTFYWPGLVYLSNASSASDPTALSATGSITLGDNLNNVIPAISTGGTGIFLETNNLVLGTHNVTTSNNSWVNFANASLASAFKLTQASSFYGAYVDNVTSTVTELGVQALPTSAFQPAS